MSDTYFERHCSDKKEELILRIITLDDKALDELTEGVTKMDRIDSVGKLALIALMEALAAGKSDREAHTAFNGVLISYGREPAPWPISKVRAAV